MPIRMGSSLFCPNTVDDCIRKHQDHVSPVTVAESLFRGESRLPPNTARLCEPGQVVTEAALSIVFLGVGGGSLLCPRFFTRLGFSASTLVTVWVFSGCFRTEIVAIIENRKRERNRLLFRDRAYYALLCRDGYRQACKDRPHEPEASHKKGNCSRETNVCLKPARITPF